MRGPMLGKKSGWNTWNTAGSTGNNEPSSIYQMDFLDDANHAPPPPLQIEKIPFSNLEMKKSSKDCTVSTPLMPMLAHIY